MAVGNLDSFNLKSALVNGLISEDIMSKIWDISKVPLPLTDMISTDSHGNEYYEWTQDQLAAPVTTNAVIDGDDINQDDSNLGVRVGNHSQTSVKNVKVSTRAIESDTIGRANELSYQVMMRQQELRRDIEATMLSGNPSIAGTDAIAGQSAGLAAWLETNTIGGAGYAPGGFNTGTGLVDSATHGTAEALTETKVRDIAEQVYTEGGNPSVFMAVPKVIRAFSEYLFTSSARVATLTSETGQSDGAATAKGSINIFVTDFGITLDLIPNRLQQVDPVPGVSNAFLIDPMHIRQSFLHSFRTEPLAKTGLSEKRLMSADWTLVVTTEKAHGMIADIDHAAPVTA